MTSKLKRFVLKVLINTGAFSMVSFFYVASRIIKDTDDLAVAIQTLLDVVHIPMHDLRFLTNAAEECVERHVPERDKDYAYFLLNLVRKYINGERL